MRQQFDKCGLDYEVFEAAIGKELNRGQYPEAASLSDGELGCALTHARIYDDIVAKGYKTAAIFEDDIMLHHDLSFLLKALETVATDDSIILLNAMFTHPHRLVIKNKIYRHFNLGVLESLPGGLGSTSGYVIGNHVAKKLATARNKNYHFKADSWVAYHRLGVFNYAQVIHPYPVMPALMSSTIGYSNSIARRLRWVPGFQILAKINRKRIFKKMQAKLTIIEN